MVFALNLLHHRHRSFSATISFKKPLGHSLYKEICRTESMQIALAFVEKESETEQIKYNPKKRAKDIAVICWSISSPHSEAAAADSPECDLTRVD